MEKRTEHRVTEEQRKSQREKRFLSVPLWISSGLSLCSVFRFYFVLIHSQAAQAAFLFLQDLRFGARIAQV